MMPKVCGKFVDMLGADFSDEYFVVKLISDASNFDSKPHLSSSRIMVF